jgi:hypothetical protein
MQDFTVYPKKGKPFTIRMDMYKRDGNQFVIYDETHQVSKDGFLAFDHIAAIVPTNPYRRPSTPVTRDAFDFRVYLRSGEQFDINADSCDTTDSSTVKFFVITRRGESKEIEGIYIAPLEVIAIMPPDGLIYRN